MSENEWYLDSVNAQNAMNTARQWASQNFDAKHTFATDHELLKRLEPLIKQADQSTTATALLRELVDGSDTLVMFSGKHMCRFCNSVYGDACICPNTDCPAVRTREFLKEGT